MSNRVSQYKNACRAYLFSLSIVDLRSYGREVGVSRPTAKKKEELIEEVIAILCGEMEPIAISKQGAPVKNDRVDERIPKRMEEIRKEFAVDGSFDDFMTADMQSHMKQMESQGYPLFMARSETKGEGGFYLQREMTGQVYKSADGYRLLPLSGEEEETETLIPPSIVESYRLREGDILTCEAQHAPNKNAEVTKILSMNEDLWINSAHDRPNLDECAVCAPRERIRLSKGSAYSSVAVKLIDWLFPLAKGQRACIVSPPKAGKTRVLLQIAEAVSAANKDLEVYVLLVEQSPEAIGDFQNVIKRDKLFYTTYEDDPDRQVFLADFLLQRAKRRVELGKDVLLLVDSLTSLAHAYNDTDESSGGKTLSCGLEIKTVRYIKKYFGSARCLEKGGSLTILGAVNAQTGNPLDDVLAAELSAQANYELSLNHELALRRIYPAVDFIASSIKQGESFRSSREIDFDFLLRNVAYQKLGAEGLLDVLAASASYKELIERIERTYKA